MTAVRSPSLRRAESAADTERTRGWVHLSREHFDYVELLTHALIGYRNWQVEKNSRNWRTLKRRVDAFDDFRTRIISYPDDYTGVWFPGHAYFCQYLSANCVKEDTTYYIPWSTRRPAVLERGVKGLAIGYGTSYYSSFVQEPLTLDFSE